MSLTPCSTDYAWCYRGREVKWTRRAELPAPLVSVLEPLSYVRVLNLAHSPCLEPSMICGRSVKSTPLSYWPLTPVRAFMHPPPRSLSQDWCPRWVKTKRSESVVLRSRLCGFMMCCIFSWMNEWNVCLYFYLHRVSGRHPKGIHLAGKPLTPSLIRETLLLLTWESETKAVLSVLPPPQYYLYLPERETKAILSVLPPPQ